jgi:hypothetical protein
MTDYELARTFHPDSPAAQALPATVRHARFHAVTRAYDVLRGKKHSLTADDESAELARRRRQRQVYRQRAAADFAEAAGVGGADEAWKDQVIIVFGLAVRTLSSSHHFMWSSDAQTLMQALVVGFVPALLSLHAIPDARHRAASANLAQARADARTFGDERRAAIRARVAELELEEQGNEESST